MNESEYRAAPGVNWSTLKHMGRSPLHYRHAVTSPSTEPSAAMLLGSAFHLLTLEPHREGEIVVWQKGETWEDFAAANPGAVKAKDYDAAARLAQLAAADQLAVFDGEKRGKAWATFKADNADKEIVTATEHARAVEIFSAPAPALWSPPVSLAETRRQHPGRIVVSAEDLALARAMAAAVRAHPSAAALLAGCEYERPVFWTDPATGLFCKGLLDACKPGVVIDLKGTRDVAPRAFGRSAAAYDYPGQHAHYGAGWEAATGEPCAHYLIAVEATAPHDVAVYELDDVVMAAARARRRGYLTRLAECEASGVWPGQVPALEPLDVPTYYMEDSDNG